MAALKKRHAEPVLEDLHLMADGAVGHVQLLGRRGEALVAGRGLESAQRVEGRQTSVHGSSRFIDM